MAYLEIETREGVRRVALDRDRLSVGRLAYNDVVLPYGQISRQHAELRRVNGQWWIADLHSTNGLHVASRRVQEHALKPGDTVVLAPGINLRLVTDGDIPPAHPPAHPPAARPSPGSFVPPESVAPMRPRSVYSDDEVPFVPPGMARPTNGGAVGPAASSAPTLGPVPSGPGAGGWPGVPGHGQPSQGYPAPQGPLVGGGAGSDDPFRRSAPNGPRQTIPTSPVGKLLHVCQTCGQLTAPDAVFCQSCHQTIARECPICRLALLPIQDRCPRCHTPNDAFVGRAHQGR